jgi:hypothetical protein
LIRPGVEFKSVKGDAPLAYRDFAHVGAYFAVESIPVHAEVSGRMAEPYEARQEWERLGHGHGDVPEALEQPMWMGTGPLGVWSLSLMIGFCTRSSGGPSSLALAVVALV